MNLEEAAAIVGIAPDSLKNYLKRRRPILASTLVVKNGRLQRDIATEDLQAWQARIARRKPFGANLHKSRRVTP